MRGQSYIHGDGDWCDLVCAVAPAADLLGCGRSGTADSRHGACVRLSARLCMRENGQARPFMRTRSRNIAVVVAHCR